MQQADKTALGHTMASANTDFSTFSNIFAANEEGVKFALIRLPFRIHRKAIHSDKGQSIIPTKMGFPRQS
jgi:hypothetical protein